MDKFTAGNVQQPQNGQATNIKVSFLFIVMSTSIESQTDNKKLYFCALHYCFVSRISTHNLRVSKSNNPKKNMFHEKLLGALTIRIRLVKFTAKT